MARTAIGSIIDELVTIEAALTGTKATYDEMPESIAATPAWLNFPLSGILNEHSGMSDDEHVIGCACVVRRALSPSDETLMRPMITRFADALSDNITLGGTVMSILETTYEYGLIETLSSPEDLMFGIMFRVRVHCQESITVSA